MFLNKEMAINKKKIHIWTSLLKRTVQTVAHVDTSKEHWKALNEIDAVIYHMLISIILCYSYSSLMAHSAVLLADSHIPIRIINQYSTFSALLYHLYSHPCLSCGSKIQTAVCTHTLYRVCQKILAYFEALYLS